MLDLVENEVALRCRRASFMPQTLLGEPAWDSLLVLYLAAARSESMTLGTLAARIGMTEPVTLHYIEESLY